MIQEIYCNEYQEKSFLKFEWIITEQCNRDCSYCYIGDKFNKILLDNNILEAYAKQFESINTTIDYFKLCGGECTIVPNIVSLYDILYHNKYIKKLGLATNGQADLNLYKQLIFKKDSQKIRFDISIHLDFFNKQQYYDLFDLLISNKIYTEILLMYHPSFKVEQIIDIYNEIKNLKLDKVYYNLKIKTIDYFGNARNLPKYHNKDLLKILPYTVEQNTNYDNIMCIKFDNRIETYSMEEFKYKKFHTLFNGMKCRVYDFWRIMPTGIVTPRCYNYGSLTCKDSFHIMMNKKWSILYKLRNKFITCKWTECNCPGNIRIYKKC